MNSKLTNFFITLNKYGIKKDSFIKKSKTLKVDKLILRKINDSELKTLNDIEYIEGELIIDEIFEKTLDCFHNLKKIKTLTIRNSNKLESIVGFNSLSSVESLIIDNNVNLKEVFGFNKLFYISSNVSGSIKIINNPLLKSISFLRGIKSVGSSFYLHNNSLITLEGLEDLESVNASFSLSSNKLTSLKKLKNLKIIDGMLGLVNNNLETLEGLEQLEHLKTIKWNGKFRTIVLARNKALKDISSIQNVCEVNNNCIIFINEAQEFTFKPDQKSVFANNNIKVYDYDSEIKLDQARVSYIAPNPKHRYIDINPEFALDDDWRPELSFHDYAALRGRRAEGVQLERVDLIRWNDKIYNYHFLKQHGIGTMPIIMYTQRENDNFFKNLRDKYSKGLKSFVLKSSHLSNSDGVFRVKDGRFISKNEETNGHGKLYGKPVDFDFLEKEFKSLFQHKAYGEEWACSMVAPGIILEELIENSVELNISIVFGELAGFFIKIKGTPAFDAEGNLLSKNKVDLPYWWKDACALAVKVSKLVKADQIRIDIFRHKNKLIINEITWNGGERHEYHSRIVSLLNKGYSYRLKMLGKKPLDIKNDEYIRKLLKHEEFITLSHKNILIKDEVFLCKFLIIDINKENFSFYWLNSNKNTDFYQFYKNVLKKTCSILEFEQITFMNKNRENIAGTISYTKKATRTADEKYHYRLNFSPMDNISFDYMLKVWEIIHQYAIFMKNKLFLSTTNNFQQKILEANLLEVKKNNIVIIEE